METKKDEMYTKYSIGKVAELLGLSAEAIRYYENKGIITPERDPDSGYRYYNAWDLHMLLRARHYLAYGFSLEDIEKLFKSEALRAVQDSMHEQELVIEQELIRQTNLLRRIKQSEAMLQDAMDSVGKFELKYRPGIYRIDTQSNYTIGHFEEQRQLVRTWSDFVPFTFSTAAFIKEKMETGVTGFDFGLGICEEYAKLLHVEETKLIHYYPPCLCVHTCIPSRSSIYLSVDSLQPALRYMAERNLRLSGDVVTQVVCMTKPEQEYFNWHIAWFPIAL